MERQLEQGQERQQEQRTDYEALYEALEQLRREYEDYRAMVESREALSARRAAFCRLLKQERVPERYWQLILRMTDLNALEMDGNRLADEEGERARLKETWPEFVGRDCVRGLPVDEPPVMARPRRMTVEEIMAIQDDARREREIAANHDMFGF